MTAKTTWTLTAGALVLAAGVAFLLPRMVGGYVAPRVQVLQAKAERGDAQAQADLANIYYNGDDGVVRDVARAKELWRRAAEQGSVNAQLNYATLAIAEAGTNGVPPQAVEWLKKAAAAGDEAAQRNLGILYLTGVGGERDSRRAAIWLHRAAAQGDAKAQYNLGLMFATGEGAAKDIAEARAWFRRAAANGHAEAARWLETHGEKGDVK